MGTLTNQYDTTWFPLTCLADVLVNMYMKMVGIQSAVKSPEKNNYNMYSLSDYHTAC